jgi:hypothetical protein
MDREAGGMAESSRGGVVDLSHGGGVGGGMIHEGGMATMLNVRVGNTRRRWQPVNQHGGTD